MLQRILITGILAILARGAEAPKPSGFYIVSVFFSDNGAQFYYRVIDVKQDGPGSLARYIRVAPSNLYCPRIVVQAAEARLHDKNPAQLLGGNNPCAVKPGSLRAVLKRYAQRDGHLETTSFGIVAQCGGSVVSLGIPIAESVNFERMKVAHPEIAALWNLAADVANPVFGENDIFHDRSEQEDRGLQAAGEKLIPELISGRYDTGLASAAKGIVGTWRHPSFRSLLASYHGPLSEAEANQGYVPQLLNAQGYQFSHFFLPKYPPLAQAARIYGKVELQLTVDPSTGEVHDVSAVSGHPLLKPAAIDAARQWRFASNSIESGNVNVTLDFALRCP
jgi:TonB family protein